MVVVILNWNGAELTLQALASLRAQTYPNLRAIVVDNGSGDQASEIERITTAHSGCELIASPLNLGFAGGCNLGIHAALGSGADYVLLLNNDAILAADTVERLVETLERRPGAGAASPLLYYTAAPDRLWWGGGTLTTGARVLALHDEIDVRRAVDPEDLPRQSDWLPATVLLVRRAAINAAGLLDTAYFLYWEDVDWSLRIRAAGFDLLAVRGACAWHAVNASSRSLSNAAVYYWERNRLRFLERWGSWRSRCIAWGKIGTRLTVWPLWPPRNDPEAPVKLAAYRDYVRRRFGDRGPIA
ncbi:MAG TPA: glycosyltransferase family 2 protein [Thermomicrobiaceae bacterium]|nr:glycosyltransferase family 2 protein [Thermomicrobiaceae bacterium]